MQLNSLFDRIFDKMLQPLFYLMPEGKAKCRLRNLRFRLFKSFLPIYDLVNPGDVVVQVGCWRIETVQELSNAVSDQGKVIVIEADEVNVEILKIEVCRREIHNVTIVQKAVWSCKDQLIFKVSELSHLNRLQTNSTIDPHDENSYKEKKVVEADCIDNILLDIGVDRVDHIHITANGTEIEAIEGMTKILSQNDIRVFVRALALVKSDGKPANYKIAEMLIDRGFKAVLAKAEPKFHGGNVYAWKDSLN